MQTHFTPWERSALDWALSIAKLGLRKQAEMISTRIESRGIGDERTFIDVMSAVGLTGDGLRDAINHVRISLS